MPPVSWVNPNVPAYQGIPVTELEYGQVSYVRLTMEGSKGSWPGATRYNCPLGEHCGLPTLQPMTRYGRSRWIDIGSSGPKDVHFNITTDDWIHVEPTHGLIKRDASTDARIRITVNWDQVPANAKEGRVHFSVTDGSEQTFVIPIKHTKVPDDYIGFVEGDGYIVMEAASFSANATADEYAFLEIDNYGRTQSGIEMFPMTAKNFTVGTGPSLSYEFYTHSSGEANITLDIGPSLNFLGKNKTLAFGFQLDDAEPTIIRPVPTLSISEVKHLPAAIGAVPYDWYDIVENEIRKVVIPVEMKKAGEHSITLYGMTTGVIFERVIVDFGGIESRKGSYLGPPESIRL
jgi:hypothetical protein